MDLIEILRALAGLIFVLGLIALCAFVARRYPLGDFLPKPKIRGRMSVKERLSIDPRRQLVIVGDGAREHVILLGASNDCLIESRDVPKIVTLRIVDNGPQP